jgi:hypothetical protein
MGWYGDGVGSTVWLKLNYLGVDRRPTAGQASGHSPVAQGTRVYSHGEYISIQLVGFKVYSAGEVGFNGWAMG